MLGLRMTRIISLKLRVPDAVPGRRGNQKGTVDAYRAGHAACVPYQPQPFSITFDRPLSEVLPAPSQTRRRRRGGALAGKTIHSNAPLVVAVNGPYYGGGFTVAGGARMPSSPDLSVRTGDSISGDSSAFTLL
jgi:hypothetical protein